MAAVIDRVTADDLGECSDKQAEVVILIRVSVRVRAWVRVRVRIKVD